ncbi:hypothetical protein ABL78_0401 [Leptomonas seymouri]|uniref:Uncharacterized protein n=1 Tax=Leptomonas seymouri TaxID=5684 RepID=A0A0N1IMR1_LEPSE|nr:hypothetical protein ABL78_0401 [Leptomonas seymouri]|eukprot:KPI90471.1 hypothetical protein ABL78_0401 [Leptomonas seymouri]
MRASERRLHVYQNGMHTVVKLNETRLGSSPPGGLSSLVSRQTATPADSSLRTKDKLLGACEATTNSPFGLDALGSAGEGRPFEKAAGNTIASPPPRPPCEQFACANPRPSCALLQKLSIVDNDEHKARLPSSSASGVGIYSLHGISPSLLAHHADSCITSPIESSTQPTASPPWRVNSSARGAAATAEAEDEQGGSTTSATTSILRPGTTSPSPVVVPCSDSCLSSSPVACNTSGLASNASQPQYQQATNAASHCSTLTTDQTEKLHEVARPSASSSTSGSSSSQEGGAPLQRPTLRRHGEVSMAERVLFQESGDEDEEETEDGKLEGEGCVTEHDAVSPAIPSNEKLCRLMPQHQVDGALEILQAHTPPRPPPIEDRAEPGKGACVPQPLAQIRGCDGGSSALNYTCVRASLSSCGTSVQDTHLPCDASLKRILALPLNSALAVATDSTAVCATAAGSSAMENSLFGKQEGRRGGAVSHATSEETAVPSCAVGDDHTPSSSAAEVLPFDEEVHTSTPTVTRCCEKTPTPTPNRRALLCHVVALAGSAAFHTPCMASASSGGAASGALLQTPTPRPSCRRGASTPSWGGRAEITGFPTPVKLSPIPTKVYSIGAELAAAALRTDAAAHPQPQPAAVPCTPPGLLSSPSLSSICSEEHVATPALPPAFSVSEGCRAEADVERTASRLVTLKAAASADGATVSSSRSVVEEEEDRKAENGTAVLHADPVACAPHNTSSECSVSPIRARAGQTTRVWTPQSSDASQAYFHPLSSLSCVTLSNDGLARPGVTYPRQISVSHSASVLTELAGVSNPAGYSAPAKWTALPTTQIADGPQRLSPLLLSAGPAAAANAQPSQKISQCTPFRRSILSSDLPLGDVVAAHKSAEPSLGGRISPRLFADTLLLGTPTVSVIHSPAHAMNQSCSFLLPPAETPHVQALPIPGMRHVTQPVDTTGEPPLEKRPNTSAMSSFLSDHNSADQLWLRLDAPYAMPRAAQPTLPQRTQLVSPALDEQGERKEGDRSIDGSNIAVGAHIISGAAATRHKCRVVLSPSCEAAPSFLGKSSPALRATHGTQTSCVVDDTKSTQLASALKNRIGAPRRAWSILNSFQEAPSASQPPKHIVADKGRFAASLESLPPSSLHSWSTTTASQRHQRLGLSSQTDGCYRSKEEEGHSLSYRHPAAEKSLSSTRFIDSWL